MSRFIVIEHDAKKAGKHFDFRFQIPNSNMWASFACRKQIPIHADRKILAIKTHTHTEKEATFTGIIKSGYGAGTLKKWDSGTCMFEKYTSKHIVIDLHGSKLKGIYHLVSTQLMDGEKEKYMLFKGKIK